MNYQSPIHLVADRYLDPESVKATTLKRWRKELLLRFNFSTTPTIEIEGKEYDKQTVNDTFDELEKDFPFHLKLYQNKPLLAFVESGDLRFFSDSRAQSVFADAIFQDKVYHLFAQAYGQVFTDAIARPTEENINRLSILNNSPLAITSEAASGVYASSLSQFGQFVNQFKQESAECFVKTNQYRLKFEIKKYVNSEIRKLLGLLPNSFNDLKKDYARLLHNNLLMQAIGKGRAKYLKNYDKPTLKTLLLAAEMDKEILDSPKINESIDLLKGALNGTFRKVSGSSTREKTTATTTRRPTSTGSSGTSAGATIWTIVIVVIFLLRLGLAAERCGRSNNSSSYAYNQDRDNSSAQQEDFDRIIREIQERQNRENRNAERRAEREANSVREVTPPAPPVRSASSSRNESSISKVEEVPKEKPAPKIVRKKFRQSDLFGSWVTFRVTDEDVKINYKYNIINPTQGERVITYKDKEKDLQYSVKQPFIYKLTVDKWNTGRIYMTMQSSKPIDCTRIEADTLLRIAEREIGVGVGGFNKTTAFDYLIHANRTAGLRFNKENYRPSADIEDLGLFANDDRRSQFMVGYINNLLERNGVSVGRNPMGLRWYADKEAKYWMAKRGKKPYQVAEIVMSRKKMYFKPIHFTPVDTEVQPLFWVRNVYFIDARGRKQQGDLRVTYHRKGDYFSVKTEVL